MTRSGSSRSSTHDPLDALPHLADIFAYALHVADLGSRAVRNWDVVEVGSHITSGHSGHDVDDLGISGEPAKGMLGEDHAVLDADVKDTATGPPQRHVRSWPDLANEVRRLTGARFIASLAAVLDFDVHRLDPLFVGDTGATSP